MSALARAIELLRNAYPNQPFGTRSIVVYAEQLADLDENDVEAAVRRLVNTSLYLPRISEIRRDVFEKLLALPEVDEAWDMAIEHALAVESVRRAWELPDVVRATVKSLGGSYMIRTSTNLDILASRFRKTYEAKRERMIREAAEGPPIRPEQLKPGRAPQLPPGKPVPPAVLDQAAKDAEAEFLASRGATSLAARRLRDIPESTSIRRKG